MEELVNQSIWYFILRSIPWGMILVTYIFIFVDLFYGVIVSIIKHEVESHKMLKGLQRKIFVLSVPIIGILFKAFFVLASLPADWSGTQHINDLLGVSALHHFPICFILCAFVLLMEFLSFLETSAKVNKNAYKLISIIQRNVKDKHVQELLNDDNKEKGEENGS